MCRKTKMAFRMIVVVTTLLVLLLPVAVVDHEPAAQVISPIARMTPSFKGDFNLTYYSLWNETKTPVASGASLIGDHVILNISWTFPEDVNHTKIVVNATAVPLSISEEADGHTVKIDTRSLGGNHTCLINMTAWLNNGSIQTKQVPNVFIGNFFVPHVTVLTPNGGEIWTGVNNVTWTAWDTNVYEELTFEVLLSSDLGSSFQLISSGITDYWYPWNSTGFLNLSKYIFEVRVSDGILVGVDRSDNPFRAGDTAITPTTTVTSTTTTEPTTQTTTVTSTITTPTTTEPTSTTAPTSTATTTTTATTHNNYSYNIYHSYSNGYSNCCFSYTNCHCNYWKRYPSSCGLLHIETLDVIP